MKIILSLVLLALSLAANAQTTYLLPTPQTIPLDPVVHTPTCYAENDTVRAYTTVVTGFSVDSNYVLGQATAYFTCGHSGRGSNIHTYYSCAQLIWDLSGNLTSAIAPVVYSNGQPVSSNCPNVPLVLPSRTPPSTTVIGNEFISSTGYIAETLLSQPCGSIACYGLPLSFPTLLTP